MMNLSPYSIGRHAGDGRRQHEHVLLGAVAVMAGAVSGLAGYGLAGLEPRWIVYILAALTLGLVACATNVRTWLLAGYVLTLQLNVQYWVTGFRPHMFVGQSGATSIYVALISLPALALLAHEALTDRDFVRRATSRITRRAYVPVACLVLASTVSTLASQVRFQGVCTLIELLQCVLVFTTATVCIKSRDDVAFVYKLLIATIVAQSLVYLAQVSLGVTFTAVGRVVTSADANAPMRAGGTVGSVPAGFAAFMQPLLFIVCAALLATRSRAARRGYLLLLVLGASATLLTLNRTTLIALPFGLVLTCLFAQRRRHIVDHARASMGGLALLLACAAVVAAPSLLARLELHSFGSDWQSRFDLNLIALRMIKDNPLLGVGPGAYGYHLADYAGSGYAWLYVVHNEYLMKWADIGTLGMLAWCAWYASGVRRALRCTRSGEYLVRTIGIGVAAALIVRMWDWLWWSHYPFSPEALLWFLLGLTVAVERLQAESQGSACAPEAYSAV